MCLCELFSYMCKSCTVLVFHQLFNALFFHIFSCCSGARGSLTSPKILEYITYVYSSYLQLMHG